MRTLRGRIASQGSSRAQNGNDHGGDTVGAETLAWDRGLHVVHVGACDCNAGSIPETEQSQMNTDKRFDATEITNDVIGFLVPRDGNGWVVVCEDCEKECRSHGAAPLSCKLRTVNIHPYKQTCHLCKRVLYAVPGSNACELFPVPQQSQVNPNSGGFFKWTLEIEVHKMWVADGFDLTDGRVHDIMTQHLGYAAGHEVKGRVLSRPPDEAIAEAQGYGSDVPRYIKERGK